MTFLIALTVNAAGMLLIYSLLAFALAWLRWRRRGMIAVFVAITVAGQFWIVPTLLVRNLEGAGLVSYVILSICDWLISGFSIIILCQGVRWIPRQLEDSARLDGCSWFGIYWHVVLPLVRRELGLIAFLTLTGTLILLVSPLVVFDPGLFTQWLVYVRPVWYVGGPGLARTLGLMIGASLIATLPLIVVLIFAKHYLAFDKS